MRLSLLSWRLVEGGDEVLIVEYEGELFQEWRIGDRRLCALEEGFAAGLVRYFERLLWPRLTRKKLRPARPTPRA